MNNKIKKIINIVKGKGYPVEFKQFLQRLVFVCTDPIGVPHEVLLAITVEEISACAFDVGDKHKIKVRVILMFCS